MTKRLLLIGLVFLICLTFISQPAFAQGVPFNVYGYVRDENGASVSGASVTVRSPIDQQSTTTDLAGRYAVTISINGLGDTITVSASYGYRSGSSSGVVPSGVSSMQIDVTIIVPTIIVPTSTITCSVSSSVISIGENVTISGSISPDHIGVAVTLMYTKPDGSTIVRTVTSGSGGSYYDTYMPDQVGAWTVRASWTGDADHRGAQSPSVSFIVKEPSRITVTTDKTSVTIDDPITVSGSISPLHIGVEVTLTYTLPDGTNISRTVTTGLDGTYADTYSPDQAGFWSVKSFWLGDQDHGWATSPSLIFTVNKRPSSISVSISPWMVERNDTANIGGGVSPPHLTMVTIYTSTDEGTTWSSLTSIATDAKGGYTYIWMLTQAGTFQIRTSWPGDRDHHEAMSETVTVIVGESTQSTPVTLPSGKSAIVLASTNSSSMTLTVRPEKKSISANVTGPSGTRGTLTLFIPDSLLQAYNSSIDKMLFTIDSAALTPFVTKMTNGYLITLTYTHNQRVINIYYVTYSLIVKALDYEGLPLSANAMVNISGPMEASAIINSSGIAMFTKVPAGDYTVKVYGISSAGTSEFFITGSEQITIQTSVGELLAEHEQLQEEFQKLAKEYGDLNFRSLVLLISTVVLLVMMVGLLFYIVRLRSKIKQNSM